MIDREKTKKIYFEANGFPESGPTYKSTLELYDQLIERIAYLNDEVIDLENKDFAQFKIKFMELYLLLDQMYDTSRNFRDKFKDTIVYYCHQVNRMDDPRGINRVKFFRKYHETE